ncbi:MAG: hypothetical protein KDL31_01380 [Kiritimatiellae bacterium]|nr:hypothetical protein [Kiritimatiellia bacterium]
MSVSCRNSIRAGGLLALMMGAVASGLAQDPVEVDLVIGRGWACVTETYRVECKRTETTLDLPIDEDAVSSSVSLRSPRREVDVHGWRLASSRSHRVEPPTILTLIPGDSIRPAAQGEARDRLLVDVSVRTPGTFDLVLSYLMTNWNWEASYQMSVRGEIRNPASPISIDLEGWVELNRMGSRSFLNAQVQVVGGETSEGVGENDQLGILNLDPFSPLSDLWRPEVAPPALEHAYPIPGVSTLLPGRKSLMQLVSARRVTGQRLYGITAPDIPSDIRGPGAPMTQYLLFRNDRAIAQGRSLPPGRSVIYLGALRSSIHQEGRIRHVASDAEIRVDMGPTQDLLIKRISLGDIQSAAGYYEARWALRIDNTFPVPIEVEVNEEPPVALAWTVSGSTESYALENQRILYRMTIPGKYMESVEYTVRYRLPEL